MEALQAPGSTASEPSPYKSIDSEGGEIRLVELWPGDYDDPISLSLHTVKLEERVMNEGESDGEESDGESNKQESDTERIPEPTPRPPCYSQFKYEALSYAWGTAISPHKAFVDEFKLLITESLDQGLRRLRSDGKPRMLWIDALCINQQDLEERSHQVQHMAVIYRSAEKVLIWLGEWPNAAACSHLDACQALWSSTLREDERPRLYKSLLHILQHYVEILELPWFRRLWVIQELALARRDPVVLIGSLSTDWFSFSDSVRQIHHITMLKRPNNPQLSRQFDKGWKRVSALADIRSRDYRYRGLYWCLVATRNAMSADPRDKVYGLLGLCSIQLTEAIAVDYSKSLRQVLAEATVVSILEQSAIPYLDEDKKTTGLFDRTYWTRSSWLLDLASFPAMNDHDKVANSTLVLEEREKRRGSIRLSMDYQTLFAYGRYVGTVREVQNSSWSWGEQDTGFRGQTPNAEIYDFYHNTLKSRGISPHTLLQVLRRGSMEDQDLEHFTNLLLGSRDGFRITFAPNRYSKYGRRFADVVLGHLGGRDIFITEEGFLGISSHHNCRLVPKGAILVCLFGTEVPFILAPIPGTQQHEMINIAYVPGYGNRILEDSYRTYCRATWIDFAAEGGREYAIV